LDTNNPKILIFGADGMIGHQLLLRLSRANFNIYSHFRSVKEKHQFLKNSNVHFYYSDLNSLDLSDFLNSIKPDVILNTSGITIRRGINESSSKSIYLNALFPHLLDAWARENNARFIQFSTDCVFSGEKGGYTEEDVVDALDLYGKTKGLGEVKNSNTLTLRTSMIGREIYNNTELLDWIISQKGLKVNGFSNVYYSGITTNLMSEIIVKIIENFPNLKGLYNIAGESISKYDLAKKINNIFELNIDLKEDASKHSNKTLEGTKFFNATKMKIPSWDHLILDLKESSVKNINLYN